MEDERTTDWHGLDDDGRAFLAQALGSVTDAGTGEARRLPPTHPVDPAPGVATGPSPRHTRPGPPGGLDPALATGAASPGLTELLEAAVTAGASDLHLSAGHAPHVRSHGRLRPLAGTPVLTRADVDDALSGLLDPAQRALLASSGDLDLGFGVTIGGTDRRFRAGLFREANGLAVAIRVVPATIPPLSELGLPPVVQRFVGLASGLVLVTGPTGSGKSTSLAAMVEEINRTRPAHIVTIEDPIEYRYTSKVAVIHQREVGIDTTSFAGALRHALRQDPDVILLGELRDLDTIRTALTAAETGHLVFATLHSADATSAVTRIVDAFPGDQQAQVRAQLALSLEGSVSQRLVPARGGGLTLATEVMVATSGIRNLVRESKLHQLAGLLETGVDIGMHTFDQSLAGLVRNGRVDADVARGLASATFGQRIDP